MYILIKSSIHVCVLQYSLLFHRMCAPRIAFVWMWILCTSISSGRGPDSFQFVSTMGLLPDTQNCAWRMQGECMLGSLTNGFIWSRWRKKTIPGIPGACTTRIFAYLVRGPLNLRASIHDSPTITWIKCIVSIPKKLNRANIGVIERCEVAGTDMAHLLYFMMLYSQSFHYDGNLIMGFPGNNGYANNRVDYFPYSN